jgi:hypothetical protein
MSPFVHPGLFWGGIGLVSIPIIIHLITRRRFRRLDWAAMEFLLEAMRRNRRRIRLEQIILLLLRVLLVALIALAVSRPHLSPEGRSWLAAAFRAEERVLVIDDSLSMGHVEAGRSAMERGTEAAMAALERVAAAGGRDPVTILRSSRYETPLATAITVDRERLPELRRTLQGGSMTPTATRMDLAAALEDLSTSSREERGRSVTIITDLCAADWTDVQGNARPELERALEKLAGEDETATRIVVVDVGASDRRNLGITDFALETPNPVVGITAELRLELANHGKDAARGVGVRLRTASSLAPGPRIAEIAPGEKVQLRLPQTFYEPGLTWIAAEIDGSRDGLAADDVRALVLRVVREVEVLVVDGEPSGVAGEGESDFLAQALRPEGELASGLAPSIVVESNLPREELDRFSAIFLANLPQPPGDFAAPLARYVREGGGLVVFPGDQVDGNVYERSLGAGTPQEPGPDLLPAAIGDAAGDPDRPVHVAPSFDHAAFRILAGGGEALFRLVEVARFLRLEPLSGARVIAQLTDADLSPFLVERQVGKGRVLMFSTSADVEWSSWPRSPTFLPVIQELVGTIARPQGSGWTRLAGAPIETGADLAAYQREATLRAPDYPATPETRLLAAPAAPVNAARTESAAPADPAAGAAQGFLFRIEDTRKAGVYALRLKTLAGDEELRYFAVNADGAESDLRPIAAEKLARVYEKSGLEVIRDPGAALAGDRGRFEIADALLGLFLLVLIVEGTLAWLFAHHRRGAADAAAAVRAGGVR